MHRINILHFYVLMLALYLPQISAYAWIAQEKCYSQIKLPQSTFSHSTKVETVASQRKCFA